ncbi:hypothetical protein F4781DRAFT_400931 [Annulohypoxylon bovei var. microspora]|nr:hypothetical protein F4781DRAFT_400931 [Annulohypoxylon bovei var. microspora]
MNSNTSTASGRTKTLKKRNSDVRKEQNRIASRAYREKRKQKLALLDEILKSDSQTDSMSSVSDETEGYTTSWSLQSRQASNSPIPAALSTVPVASPWPVVSPPMSSAVPGYGHDTYDGWMNSYDHPSHTYPTSNDYVQSYMTTEVGDHSLDASSYNIQSIPSVTSTPSTPPVPSIPLDPMLVSHFTQQHRHPQSAQHQNMANSSNLAGGDDEIQRQLWVGSLEENALTALERFSGYSHVQQQQVLAWIRKRRNLSHNTSSHQGLEYRYPTCQATPPPSAQFVNNDFRKYQSMRQASGSPIPHGHH